MADKIGTLIENQTPINDDRVTLARKAEQQ
jgi:hypothetical protein